MVVNRRQFLQTTSAALLPPLASARAAAGKVRRVGLIGCGWYGKIDLLRLIQVEPVEVVSLCDVDKQMLAQAGAIVASRQRSGKTPRLFSDYREMLREC